MKPHKILPIAAVAAFAAVAAPNALAADTTSTSPCAVAPTTTTFSAWGDYNDYLPFKGSNFEAGASGWSWAGKAKIIDKDDAQLLSDVGSHAVELQGGGGAKSPWTCVDSTMPSMRFLVKRVSGTGNLTVTGTLAGVKGSITTIASFAGDSTWAPSPIVAFPTTFMTTLLAGGSVNAQFQFTSDPGTVYRIDDVLMDPFRSR
jgi:hypothetical protein